jgi:predicted GIY-YIG superfamily endonuclease
MRYIYLIKDPTNDLVVYVGETSNVKQRFISHRCGNSTNFSKEKMEWTNNLKKLGLLPKFEIVKIVETKEQALIEENNLIMDYINKGFKLFNIKNRTTIKQYDLYGNLIGEFTNTKDAINKTGIRPRLNRASSGNYQWSYSDFKPDLIVKKELGKKIKCKKVLQIDKSGNIVAEFEGVRIASKITGIDHRSISQVASGSLIRKTAGGFKWKYK